MATTIDHIEAAAARIDVPEEIDIESIGRFRLSDAIREGSEVSDQAYNWSSPDGSLCALSAGLASAKARGYVS